MSFLLGADFASSSESDEEEAAMLPVLNPDSHKERKCSDHSLPSADSVLSSVATSTASFMPPKFSATAQSAVQSFNLLEDKETYGGQGQILHDSLQLPRKWEQKTAAEKLSNDRKRSSPPEVITRELSLKREKKDAKERVRSQRLKGQAGIGPDFRGWKSETEMALRQQFD